MADIDRRNKEPIDQNQLRPIMEYLKKEFPECLIRDIYDSARIVQKFDVICNKSAYPVFFNLAFLGDNTPVEITDWLNRSQLSKLLLENYGYNILINRKGLISKEKVF